MGQGLIRLLVDRLLSYRNKSWLLPTFDSHRLYIAYAQQNEPWLSIIPFNREGFRGIRYKGIKKVNLGAGEMAQ